MIGRQLGHFRIIESLGVGGMGVVYKATDLRLQRIVAVKVLPPEFSADPERRSRLQREARAASALNHPNIVTVHEMDTAEGIDFIAMEYVEGRTLEGEIGPRGLTLPEALSYASQIAEALAAAHGAGIIHRDLKPRNIMVTNHGQVKVLDFGLAKHVVPGDAASAAPTQTAAPGTAEGALIGTVAYMSPEQAQGKRLDARSDIFSFGIVLFEMLTARRPFVGESNAQVVSAILRDAPPSVRSTHPQLPEGLERILEKALEKDVELRYQHVTDLLADFNRLRRGVVHPGPTRPRRKTLTQAAAIATAVGLLAVVVVTLRERPATPRQFRLLSTFAGSHRAPSLSPDGKMMAFVDASHDVPQVFVKYLDGGDPVQITTGTVGAGRPRWSPKGDHILFERQGSGIWSVPPLGGSPRRILDRGSCPAFFPDGERIVFERGDELWTARADGAEARPLPGVPTNYFSGLIKRCAAVSLDGRLVAYFQPDRGPFGDFWLIPTSGGTPLRLTSDSAEGGGLTWLPDGSLIVSSGRRGGRTLWRVWVSDREPEPVTTGAGSDLDPEISRDGTRLVYTNARHTNALMLLDTATGGQRPVLERRLQINGPSFSPDGQRIAFFMTTDELEHIFTVGVDGSELHQVTKGQRVGNIMPHWSGDGTALYFYQELGQPSFRKVPATGGASQTVIDGWQWPLQNGARWDPQERRLAYALFEQGRLKATLLRDLATGRETPLERNLYPAEWSPDGQRLVGTDWPPDANIAETDGDVLVCPAVGGACQRVGQGRFAAWSGDGSRIYVERNRKALDDPALCSVEVWVMAADGRAARRLAILAPVASLTSEIAVSTKDQIAWVQFRRGQEELWLAELGQVNR